MPIYPDKKDGKLTGRFRVELKQGTKRYRKRWDTLALAKTDEDAVIAAWARGDDVGTSERAPGAPDTHTLATTFPLARGMLWRGQSTEELSWARMDIIAGILGPNTRLDAIDTHSIDKIMKDLLAKGKSDGTVNRYLAHLSKFLKWAKARKYRTVPLDDITYDKNPESAGRIRWITAEEEAALEAFFMASDKAEAHHVWTLIRIAIATGCRRDELLTATPEQVVGGRLHLWAPNTKTKTSRTVPLAPETSRDLMDLIVSGNMPSRRGLRSWWERARASLGLTKDPDFVFHTCRHTCATRMVDAGVNILVIQAWLGHKVIQTTLRYAHVRSENLEDALVKVGNFKLLQGGKAQETAVSDLPHHVPTGGVNTHFSRAA